MLTPKSRFIFANIPWYGFLIAVSILCAYLLAEHKAKKLNLKKDSILDLLLFTIPIGIVGARIYYVLFSDSLAYFIKNPINILYIWNGGLAIYGGIIAGCICLLIFCRYRKIDKLIMLDILAPSLILAQAIGRWGNYFNIEAFGLEVKNKALQFFPLCVYIPSSNSFHLATFFYESIANLICFFYLNNLFYKRKYNGQVFFSYLFYYGLIRCFNEGLRLDSLYFFSLRTSQVLSLLLIAVALYFLLSKNIKSYMIFLPNFFMTICIFQHYSFNVLIALYVIYLVLAILNIKSIKNNRLILPLVPFGFSVFLYYLNFNYLSLALCLFGILLQYQLSHKESL